MSTLLIATDEAGYGPKLGPLVIAATAWEIPELSERGWISAGSRTEQRPVASGTSMTDLVDLFAPLRLPYLCGQVKVAVADSKAVFKSTQKGTPGLRTLHTAVSAAIHWTGSSESRLANWLTSIAAADVDLLSQTDWFGELNDRQFVAPAETGALLNHWRTTGLRLCGIRARIITARQFNSRCSGGCNKADLLSESTIGLVRSMISDHRSPRSMVNVFCDRHGGRRYYGAVLQHVFPDFQLQVITESKQQSHYRLSGSGQTVEIAFTVKGDSFTPVAMSSMVAKYLRERLMESFNLYFALRHRGTAALKPTAGYPVDADRFLQDIRPIIESEKIDPDDLIRCR